MSLQNTQRTIDEVIDVETGEIIKSDVFFQKPESEIIAYRRRLQEAITGIQPAKFKCAYCNQLLKLSGKQTRRGQVSFFSHLYDSDECEIKTNGDLSREEIEARKYGNIGESERHIQLKTKLAEYLESTPGVSNVEIEKRVTSEVPYLYWRKPDVYIEYLGNPIVFELQLSTTFLSVIVERDIFYRLNNIFIIWVFNFSENQEYVNFQNLMIKDIYYANKRNAFVFDEKAQRLSEETGELHLLCIWFEPLIEEGVFQQDKAIMKEKHIKISDLKYDAASSKPYYIDADSMFAKFQPSYFESRLDFENLKKIQLEKIARKNNERETTQLSKAHKIQETKDQLKRGDATLQPFEKSGKFGLQSNGITIIEPTYSEVVEIVKDRYYKIQKYKKYGIINNFGEEVLACDYKQLILVFGRNFIANERNEWQYIDVCTNENIFIHKSKSTSSEIQLESLSENAVIIRIEETVGILHRKYKFQKYDSISDFGSDGVAIAQRKDKWEKNKEYKRKWLSPSTILIPGRTTYIDKTGEELISNSVEIKPGVFKGIKYDKWGIETIQKENIIPFEYESIDDFIDGKAKARKNGFYGLIDEEGKTLVPFEYDLLGGFADGKARAMKNGVYNLIHDSGKILITFDFDYVDEFIEGKAKAKKDGKCGCVDTQGKTLIPFEYHDIDILDDGKVRAKRNNEIFLIDYNGNGVVIFSVLNTLLGRYGETIKDYLYGIKDTQGNVLLEPKYNKIDDFRLGFAKIYSNKQYIGGGRESPKFKYKVGYVDEQGRIAVPCIYDSISDFVDGRATAKINGKKVRVKMYKIEYEPDTIDLSKFKLNSIHNGKITKIARFGLFVKLDNKAVALLHISELKKHQKLVTDYLKGQVLEVRIVLVDEEKGRISVTLSTQESEIETSTANIGGN